MSTGLWVVMFDASKRDQAETFYFNASDAPRHMKERIANDPTKSFAHIDGESMGGLVDEDSEESAENVEEILDYLREKMEPEYKFKPGGRPPIDIYISIAAGLPTRFQRVSHACPPMYPRPQVNMSTDLWVLMFDASEGNEPETFYFKASDAPRHMKAQIAASDTKSFEHIDGESMGGLVDEDSEEAEGKAEEVMEYLREKMEPKYKFMPGGRPAIDIYISIAAGT